MQERTPIVSGGAPSTLRAEEGLPAEDLLALLPVAVLVYRGEIVSWVNEALTSLLRYRPEDLIGHSIFELIDTRDVPVVRQRMEARRRGEGAPEAYEIELRCGDGSKLRTE